MKQKDSLKSVIYFLIHNYEHMVNRSSDTGTGFRVSWQLLWLVVQILLQTDANILAKNEVKNSLKSIIYLPPFKHEHML